MKQFDFYCDANLTTGLGHFSRCKRIALKMVHLSEDKIEICFIGEISEEVGKEIKDYGWNFKYTKAFQRQNMSSNKIAIIDSYRISNLELFCLNNRYSKTVFIDDFNKNDFSNTDLIINFRLDARKLNYKSANIYCGLNYFPADDIMMDTRSNTIRNLKNKTLYNISNVLVYLGAASDEIIRITLNAIDKCLTGKKIILVSGLRKIDGILKSNNNEININSLTNSLSRFISKADIVISSGGLIKYEAAFCVTPNACINSTKEQLIDSEILSKRKLTYNFGLEEDLIKNPDVLSSKMKKFLSNQEIELQRKSMVSNFYSNSTKNIALLIMKLSQ